MSIGGPVPLVRDRSDTIGVALVLVAAVSLASKGIAAKLLYAEGLDLPTVLFLRMMFATPVFWVFALAKYGRHDIVGASIKGVASAAVVGVICYYAGGLADMGALLYISASVQRLLLFSYPAFVVLLDAALRRQLPPRQHWLALALTYVGIFFVMGGFDQTVLAANLTGAGLAILAALTFAVYLLVNQKWGRIIGSIRFTLFAQTGAATAMALHFAIRGGADLSVISLRAWWIVAFLVIVATCVAWFAFSEGIRLIGATRAALISTIGPPATLGIAHLMLGETLTLLQMAGAGVVALGVVVLELRPPPVATPLRLA